MKNPYWRSTAMSCALDLHAQASRLARHLYRLGVRAGDRVGLLLGRPADCYAALLAALEIGAAYVPLDPGSPADSVASVSADAGLDVLLTTTADRHAAAGVSCRVLALDAA
jgi:non-ribosomal peptide synthetase component F